MKIQVKIEFKEGHPYEETRESRLGALGFAAWWHMTVLPLLKARWNEIKSIHVARVD